jgi:hypothetical protein
MHIELGADYTGDSEIYQGVCMNQIMDGGRRFFQGGSPFLRKIRFSGDSHCGFII